MSTTCAANGDLKALATAVLARLATPETTKVTEPTNGIPIVLDATSVEIGIRFGMQVPGIAANIPSLIAGLANGSADEMFAGLDVSTVSAIPPSAVDLTIACQNSDYNYPGLQQTAKDHAGVFSGFSLKGLCDLIGPVPQWPALPKVTSDVPVLVVLPSYDTQSSETTAKAIFAGFAHATFVSVPGVSDPVVQVACYQGTRTAFVENPTAKLDTACLISPDFKTFT